MQISGKIIPLGESREKANRAGQFADVFATLKSPPKQGIVERAPHGKLSL
jgi:hypothetical protein